MKIIQTSQMPNGTRIQVEDWREDYAHVPRDELTLAAFPISKEIHMEIFGYLPSDPEQRTFRCSFHFKDKDIDNVFYSLREGRSDLKHYAANLVQSHREKGYGQYL